MPADRGEQGDRAGHRYGTMDVRGRIARRGPPPSPPACRLPEHPSRPGTAEIQADQRFASGAGHAAAIRSNARPTVANSLPWCGTDWRRFAATRSPRIRQAGDLAGQVARCPWADIPQSSGPPPALRGWAARRCRFFQQPQADFPDRRGRRTVGPRESPLGRHLSAAGLPGKRGRRGGSRPCPRGADHLHHFAGSRSRTRPGPSPPVCRSALAAQRRLSLAGRLRREGLSAFRHPRFELLLRDL